MQLLESAQVVWCSSISNREPLTFRSLQELDFFEMSQSKSVGPDERDQATAVAAAAAAAAVFPSSQSIGAPAVAVSVAPATTSSSSPLLPPHSAPRFNRVILSSSASDDDDDTPLVTSSVPRPSGRMSIVPVDAQGVSSVLSQPLTIGTPPHPSSPPPASTASRDLRRMSVANGEMCAFF